jgi:hypothetical protein
MGESSYIRCPNKKVEVIKPKVKGTDKKKIVDKINRI